MSSVLFVDDKKELLDLINIKLKDENYKKFYAESALDALKILDEENIDVLITDMIMPDMSGMQLLQIVNEKHPAIVKIVLSGHSQVPIIVSAINEGKIYKYITKPWRITDESKALIREAIEHSKKNTPKSNDDGCTVSVSIYTIVELAQKFSSDFAVTTASEAVYACGTLDGVTNSELAKLDSGGECNCISLNDSTTLYYK